MTQVDLSELGATTTVEPSRSANVNRILFISFHSGTVVGSISNCNHG
jgi:hypothetical protein